MWPEEWLEALEGDPRAHVDMSVCVCMCTCVCMCIYIYIYIYMWSPRPPRSISASMYH